MCACVYEGGGSVAISVFVSGYFGMLLVFFSKKSYHVEKPLSISLKLYANHFTATRHPCAKFGNNPFFGKPLIFEEVKAAIKK